MSSVRDTEERLRTWLSTDQASKERMCIGVLALDTRFVDVKPRRPKGGPDGARDIEAMLAGEPVWGGVGFSNNANDSDENKKWVKKKFTDDIINAKKENNDLKKFIFFTNIDLTPGEYDELVEIAKNKGFNFVEIFYRERLRIVLDSPEGLGLRYQYLNLPLTEPEQAAFFSKWGQGLESLIVKNFYNIDRKLNRLEFISQMNRQIYSIDFIITLNRDYTALELGDYKFLCEISDTSINKDPWDKVCLAGYSANATEVNATKETLLIGIHQLVWYNYDSMVQL